jgi:hypothetical protein
MTRNPHWWQKLLAEATDSRFSFHDRATTDQSEGNHERTASDLQGTLQCSGSDRPSQRCTAHLSCFTGKHTGGNAKWSACVASYGESVRFAVSSAMA